MHEVLGEGLGTFQACRATGRTEHGTNAFQRVGRAFHQRLLGTDHHQTIARALYMRRELRVITDVYATDDIAFGDATIAGQYEDVRILGAIVSVSSRGRVRDRLIL